LIVLVDGFTASASEQFVAQLQAGKAALVVGSPTHGSGCGYITGTHGKAGSETVLKNSGGKLFMPNCARFLPDGRNEVGGLEPDILLPFRANDTPHQKAGRLSAALPRLLTAVGASPAVPGAR
jgi:C-terminal processing protease CtpA/Prc